MKKGIKIILILVFIDIFIGLYYSICFILPKISLYRNNDITVYDSQNEIIFETHHDIPGHYVGLNEMSPYLPVAFIAAEDQNFYHHYGYDLKGMLRATWNTLFKGKPQGGSTITQQLARSLFLTNEKSFSRKIHEAILTARIETNYSKKQILEQYLNTIYLGHDLYGVSVGAQYYFNKDCKNLTLDEAALLAGIANAPAYNDPNLHYDNAIYRRNYVLKNLYHSKIITTREYNENIHKTTQIHLCEPAFTDANLFYHRAIVKELEELNLYNKKNLAIGLDVYVSLQQNISQQLYQILKKHQPNTNTQVAVLILKPYTNQILAMAGSFDVHDEFNRSMMALRPIGSTIKPMIYYMALDYGLTPVSKFMSEETLFYIDGIGEYAPKNSHHQYPNKKITMIEALAVSDNIYATKTLLFIGSKNLNQFLNLFGINYDKSVPSMALGVSEMSLLDLASIYNTFASEGKYYQPHFIQKVVDKKGKVLYKAPTKGKQILNPTSTLILNQLLRAPFDEKAYGYAKPTLLNYQPKAIFAAKTGTTNSDAYTIGYNPNYTIAIWVGKDDNSPLYETQLSKTIFVDLANQITSDNQLQTWYDHGYFIYSAKINPLTGNKDANGSFYWFKS